MRTFDKIKTKILILVIMKIGDAIFELLDLQDQLRGMYENTLKKYYTF